MSEPSTFKDPHQAFAAAFRRHAVLPTFHTHEEAEVAYHKAALEAVTRGREVATLQRRIARQRRVIARLKLDDRTLGLVKSENDLLRERLKTIAHVVADLRKELGMRRAASKLASSNQKSTVAATVLPEAAAVSHVGALPSTDGPGPYDASVLRRRSS